MKANIKHSIAPKKSDSKKKTEATNCFSRSLSPGSKSKSNYSKQTIRRKRNEFDDTDF